MMETKIEKRTIKELGRIIAGLYYDSQEVRIGAMNRIRDVIRKDAEGIAFDEVEEKKEDDKKYQSLYTDAKLPALIDQLLADGKIGKEEFEYIQKILSIKKEAEAVNHKYLNLMNAYIEEEPIYQQFLKHIKGVGPVISCRLIKHFGYAERAKHVSSLWKLCGMHVVDGAAPKRKRGEKLDWDPQLRSFVWNIADSFVKQRTPFYRGEYDKERKRQDALVEAGAENAPKNGKHADLRARRRMVKLFLAHYVVACKELTGQAFGKGYVFDKLGHEHYVSWRAVVEANLARSRVEVAE